MARRSRQQRKSPAPAPAKPPITDANPVNPARSQEPKSPTKTARVPQFVMTVEFFEDLHDEEYRP